MHRSSGAQVAEYLRYQYQVDWTHQCHLTSTEDWLTTKQSTTWKDFFAENGFLVVEDLLLPEEIKVYQDVYDKLISGTIDASDHRHDLGNHTDKRTTEENICQIMWPSLYVKGLTQGPLHERTYAVAKTILGPDVEMDFDMLIFKAPHTNTETPWHQDESYWPDLPDKRAVSCWVALDEATVDNGCMWFVPGSNKQELREHRPAKPGCHVLMCDSKEGEGQPFPIKAGSCTFHHGRTLHHTEGNTTDRQRRAYITNYRPGTMVELERSAGYDHGLTGISNVKEKGLAHGTKDNSDKNEIR